MSEPTEPASPPGPGALDLITGLILPVYLPGLFVQTAVGMLVPLLPLYLDHLGRSATALGVVVAAAGVGSMLSQLPAGQVLSRIGEREVMVASIALLALSTLATGWVSAVAALVGLRLVWGIGSTGWLLSRQTLMTRAIPAWVRGRAISLFGGLQRGGLFIGALLGGYTVQAFGYRWAFGLAAGLTVVGILPLLADRSPALEQSIGPSRRTSAWSTFSRHRRLLAVAGAGQVAIITVRNGRQVILPLIAITLGLDPAEVGVLVGIGNLADFALSPVAGMIMDAAGRMFAIVPAFLGMAVGFVLLARADDYTSVAVAAVVIGLANAIGSGTMLTMASDLAPPDEAPQFLAALGTVRESGKIAGPIVVGWLADRAGEGAAAIALAVLAVAATAILFVGIGETRDRVT